MEWRSDLQNHDDQPVAVFEPGDVVRLFELADGLPWLQTIDPYRDHCVRGADLDDALKDVDAVAERVSRQVLTAFAHSKKTNLARMTKSPYLMREAERRLADDPFFVRIRRARALLLEARATRSAVLILGT
jgi:hypothetical protein